MLWDSPPPSALVQLPVVLKTLALGVSPGRPLPEAVLIPRWHLRHTWDSHLGPCRSPRPISLQAPLPCLGSLGCSRQASRGGVGHPARLPRAVAQHSGLAGSPSRHPGVGRAREAARPQRPGFPEGPQPAPQAWPACCWPWGQAARLQRALATSRPSTGLGVGETESGPQGRGERRS